MSALNPTPLFGLPVPLTREDTFSRWNPATCCHRAFALPGYPGTPDGVPCPVDGCGLECTTEDPVLRAEAEAHKARRRVFIDEGRCGSRGES